MKKWLYLLVPAVGLVAFVFAYNTQSKQWAEQAQARAADVARKKDAEDAAKKLHNQEAVDLANKKKGEDADEAAHHQAEIDAKNKADDDKVRQQTADAMKDAADHAKNIADFDRQIADLQAQREQLSHDYVDLAKQVALANIARRDAELNVQLEVQKLVAASEKSSLIRMPPPPPPPAPAAR